MAVERGDTSIGMVSQFAPNVPVGDVPSIPELPTSEPTDRELIDFLLEKFQNLQVLVQGKADKDKLLTEIAYNDEGIKIQAEEIALVGNVTIAQIINDQNGSESGQVDALLTRIIGDKIQTGSITSTNYGAGAGSQFNLNDGTLIMGGSSDPAFEFDGSDLYITGTVQAGSIIAESVTVGADTMGDIRDNANQAVVDAANAIAAAGGTLEIYVQSSAPTITSPVTYTVGDIWILNSAAPPYTYSMIRRWDGDSWETEADNLIGQLAVDTLNSMSVADTAASLADGRIRTYAGPSEPGALKSGTANSTPGNGRRLVDTTGTFLSGVSVGDIVDNTTDGSSAQVLEILSNTTLVTSGLVGGTRSPGANQWVSGDGYEIGAPHEGDYWVDTSAGVYDYILHRWDGADWESQRDTGIQGALDDADSAQTTADGKSSVYAQNTNPGTISGDLFIDTNSSPDNAVYYDDGSLDNVSYQNDLALIAGDFGDIDDGGGYSKTTTNEKTGAGRGYNALDSSYNYIRGIWSNRIVISESQSSGVVFDDDGIRGYSSSQAKFDLQTDGDLFIDGQLVASGNSSGTGGNGAIVAEPDSSVVWGVIGYQSSSSAGGVLGKNAGSAGVGVLGWATTSSGVGVKGQASNSSGSGVEANNSSSGGVALYISNGEIEGDLVIRDTVDIEDTTDSTSEYTGALTVAGGLGVGKDAYIGGNLSLDSDSPSSSSSGYVRLYGAAITGGTTLGIVTHVSPTPTASFTLSHKVKVEINGTEYWWPLEAV